MSFLDNQLNRADGPAAAALPRTVATDQADAVSSAAGHDETVPRVFLVLCDASALVVAFFIAHVIAPWMDWVLLSAGPLRFTYPAWLALPQGPNAGEFPPLSAVTWMLVVTAPATILLMELFVGYRQLVYQSRARLLISSVLSPFFAMSFVTLALFALKISSSSRVLFFTFALFSVAGLFAYRSCIRVYKRRLLNAGAYAKNVVLVGRPSAVVWMTDHFRRDVPENRFRLLGWLRVGKPNEAGSEDSVRLESLGAVDDLGSLLINRPIHEVIAVQSQVDRDWLKQVIEECDYFRVRLRIVPEALLVGTLRDLRLVFRSEPLRLPEVVLAPPHLESDALFLKRLIDIVVSALLLVLLAPVFLLIALAIKLTTPHLAILYPWRVIGLKGRAFTGYKFTTMSAEADERRNELLALNEMQGPVFKLANDPRVTPLGRFLRKYSLNELPQLWSVLTGDMSLVGPRPAFRHELDRYELWQKRKLCVKPGITCLWQVSGRNRINSFDEWVKLDLDYIHNWSLWLDMRILVRTVWAVLGGTGS